MDIQFKQDGPEAIQDGSGVGVELGFANPEEPPPASFEVALSGEVAFVGVGACQVSPSHSMASLVLVVLGAKECARNLQF